MTLRLRARIPALFAAATLLASCDNPSAPPPEPGAPARLEVVSGDAQRDTVGQELPQPLVIRVTDGEGRPVPGQVIDFRVASGGGSVFAGAARTDEDGRARERWTLGTSTAGAQRIEARALDPETGAVTVFAVATAVALADAPASIAAHSAAAVAGLAGFPLPDSVAARVRDRHGNPVPDATVAWTVRRGGGSLSPAQSRTDSAGVARAVWTLGTFVDSTQVAEAAAAVGMSTAFAAQAGVPPQAAFVPVSGDAQSGEAGQPLAEPVVVALRLPDGRPLAGAAVVWTVGASGGGVNPATSVTDAAGRASTVWTLPTTAGAATLVASSPGVFPAGVTAAVRPAAPATLARVHGDGQAGAAGAALADSLAVRLLDAYGNPVPGAAVAWSVRRGGGSVSPGESRTDAAGVARARWTLGPRVDSAQAAGAAAAGMAAEFAARAAVPANAVLSRVSGDGQTGVAGQALAQPAVVALRLADGRPVVGAAVTWAPGGGAGSATPAAALTDTAGRASTVWTLPGTAGPAALAASSPGLDAVGFAATVTHGPAAALARAGGDGQAGSPGATLPDSLAARVVDAYGNPVAGETVQWTVTGGGGSVSPATSVTGAAGVARTAWRLGNGTPSTVRASSGTLEPVIFTATPRTAGSISINVSRPGPNAVVGDSLVISLQVTSTYSLTRLTARVDNRSAPVGPTGGHLNLAGLASGAKELRITAVDVYGDSAVRVVPVLLDRPPRLTAARPAAGEVALGGQLVLDATCVDDGGCARITAAAYQGSFLTSLGSYPGNRAQASMSLASYMDREITVVLEAVDAHGQRTQLRRRVFLAAAPRWTEIAAAGTRMWDIDGTRLLFMDSTAVRLRDRATGAETLLGHTDTDRSADTYFRGYLHPAGAIFGISDRQLVDWRNGVPGTHWGAPSQLQVKGPWAMWTASPMIYRRNLATGTTATVSPTAYNINNDLAANGDVVYVTHASDIYRYRNGASTPVAVGDPVVFGGPVTDGSTVLYRRTEGGRSWVMRVDPAGSTSTLYEGPGAYALTNGWIAYTLADAGGAQQVWVRAPDGTARQATFRGASSSIVALNENGRLVTRNAGRMYLSSPPYASAVDVGPYLGAYMDVRWRGDELLAFLGRSVFRVSY